MDPIELFARIAPDASLESHEGRGELYGTLASGLRALLPKLPTKVALHIETAAAELEIAAERESDAEAAYRRDLKAGIANLVAFVGLGLSLCLGSACTDDEDPCLATSAQAEVVLPSDQGAPPVISDEKPQLVDWAHCVDETEVSK